MIENQEPKSVENRNVKRYRYAADATLRPLDSGLTFPGVLLDLSAGGCLLRLTETADIKIGTSVDLGVNSKAVTFRAVGSVRRCSRELNLIGISFVNLNRQGQADLRDLIDELQLSQHPDRSPK